MSSWWKCCAIALLVHHCAAKSSNYPEQSDEYAPAKAYNGYNFYATPLPVGHGSYPESYRDPQPIYVGSGHRNKGHYQNNQYPMVKNKYRGRPSHHNVHASTEKPYFAQFSKDDIRNNPNRRPYKKDEYGRWKHGQKAPIQPPLEGTAPKGSPTFDSTTTSIYTDFKVDNEIEEYEPCIPRCVNEDWTRRECGPNGCGGTCGPKCPLDKYCSHENGTCLAATPPAPPQPINCTRTIGSSYTSDPSSRKAIDVAISVDEDNNAPLVYVTRGVNGIFVYNSEAVEMLNVPASDFGLDKGPGSFAGIDVLNNAFQGTDMEMTLVVTANNRYGRLNFNRVSDSMLGVLMPIDGETTPPQVFVDGIGSVHALALAQDASKNPVAYVSQENTGRVAIVPLFNPPSTDTVTYSAHDIVYLQVNTTFLVNGNSWTPCRNNSVHGIQVNGIAIDRPNNAIYFAQEGVGLYRTTISSPQDDLQLVDVVDTFGAPYKTGICNYGTPPSVNFTKRLGSSVSGVSIIAAEETDGFVAVANSENPGKFALYSRLTNQYIGTYLVKRFDSDKFVNSPPGIASTTLPLADFPQGLFVSLDSTDQSLSYVSIENITASIKTCNTPAPV